MLPLRVFIVSSSDELNGLTESSVRLGLEGIKAEVVLASESEILSKIVEVDCDIIHIVKGGFIVLSDFYKALLLMIEETGYDYVCSHCQSVWNGGAKIVDSVEDINPSQFLIHQWVAKELGPPATIEEMFSRIIVEYKGEEFKGVLGVSLLEAKDI